MNVDPALISRHVFVDGRCKSCGIETLEDDIYGPFKCAERGQTIQTPETRKENP